jgi:hypothetical protein
MGEAGDCCCSILYLQAIDPGRPAEQLGERAAFGSFRVEAGRFFLAGERPALVLCPAVSNLFNSRSFVKADSDSGDALNFKEATDLLIQKVTVADIAEACGSHVNSVERARLSPDTRHYREPPPGWIAAVARVARERGRQLIALADTLERSIGHHG